jgi:haloalkane dehalogenase
VSILHGTLPSLEEDRARTAVARLAPIADLYPFRPRFHLHDGVAQHYLDEGPADAGAETLLFLHGNPTWSFAWRRAVGRFSAERRCVVPDHVGCGLSDKPGDYAYRLENHVLNLERLVLALDLRDVTLVAHDWGGAIGMGLARRHPDRIARLVLMNTAAFRSPRIPLRIAACRTPVFGRLAVRGLNAFARAATFMAVERPLTADVKRGYLLPYDSWEARVATHAFVEDIPMKPGHPSWDELAATEAALERFVDRPVCLLWGERDWCFTPAFREEWQRRFPAAEVHRFDGAGHYLFEDEPEGCLEALAGFLGRHPIA